MERTTQLWECCGSTVWCDEGPGFHLSSKTNSDFGSFKGAFRAIETWASSDLYFAMAARDVLFVGGWALLPVLFAGSNKRTGRSAHPTSPIPDSTGWQVPPGKSRLSAIRVASY